MANKASRQSSARRARALQNRPDWTPSAEAAQREVRRTLRSRYRRHRRRALVVVIALSLALGYAIFRLGFELVTVRGVGMSPALESGHMVLCVKQSALDQLAGIVPEHLRRVRRGDAVLVRYTTEPDPETGAKPRQALLIKRVIGLGGDRIDAGGGELIVNQQEVAGAVGSSDLVYPVVVPTGRMFLAGDNRDLSVDSRQRAFGMVAEAEVLARPLLVVWPVYAIGAAN